MKKSVIWDMAGVFIGIIVLIGGLVMWMSGSGTGYVASTRSSFSEGSATGYEIPLKFGADFYTEMHGVTASTNNSIVEMHQSVKGIGERIENSEAIMVDGTNKLLNGLNRIYACFGICITIIGTLMLLVFGKRVTVAIGEIPKKEKLNKEFFKDDISNTDEYAPNPYDEVPTVSAVATYNLGKTGEMLNPTNVPEQSDVQNDN